MFKGWIILIAIAIGYGAHAQSLRGKVIYISSSQPVKFKFGSRISDYGFTERTLASQFKVEVSKKNLSVTNIGGDFKTVNLVVSEGTNAHLFIVYYSESAASETYDFSTPELLKAEIEEITKGNVEKPAPPVQTITAAINKPVENVHVEDTVQQKKMPQQEKDSGVDAIAGNGRAQETKSFAENTVSENTVKQQPQNVINTPAKTTPRPPGNLREDAIAADEGANTPNKPTTPIQQSSTANKPQPKVDGTIILMNEKPAKQQQRKDSIIFMSGVDKSRLEKNPAVRVVQPERKDSIILISSKSGKLSTETSNPSKPSFEDHYNQLIHLGDSTAWIAKDLQGSLRWYDSARKLSPFASYPLKQVNAVRAVLKEQAEAAKTARSAKFKTALADYKAADALRVERKFEDAYKGYSKFLSQLDSSNEYKSSELYYINQAKDYLVRLQPYLPKPKPVMSPVQAQDNGKKKKRKAAGH